MARELTDHDRRQLAGQWARRYPAAMLHSPYLTPAELRAAQRRVANRGRECRRAHVWLAGKGYVRPDEASHGA